MNTHTYARLDISPEAYAEIAGELIAAGYGHVFTTEGHVREVMVMTGIALAAKKAPKPRAAGHME